MVDVYLMETSMREQKADVQRRAALAQTLRELEQPQERSGETRVARLRRAAMALSPIRRVNGGELPMSTRLLRRIISSARRVLSSLPSQGMHAD